MYKWLFLMNKINERIIMNAYYIYIYMYKVNVFYSLPKSIFFNEAIFTSSIQ